MPWPSFTQPFHRWVNPIALRFAGGFGSLVVLEHLGRRSGKVRHTPVRAFRRDGVVAVGANFGAQSDWVKNVLAAGGYRMTMRGHRLRLSEPRLVPLEEAMAVFPAWFSLGLRYLVHTEKCLLLTVVGTQP